jgi:hypothetical protein
MLYDAGARMLIARRNGCQIASSPLAFADARKDLAELDPE